MQTQKWNLALQKKEQKHLEIDEKLLHKFLEHAEVNYQDFLADLGEFEWTEYEEEED